MAFTTHFAERVRGYLADPGRWRALPGEVRGWLATQQARSTLPAADQLLIETFPRRGREFLVVYAFVGWNAHQTLGMLLTRRMERHGLRPLGFNASDYMLAIWSLEPAPRPRGAVRCRHPGRGARALDGGLEPAEAHVQERRRGFRADRAAPSRAREERPPAHGQLRPDL
jgi:hypothetical protein